MKAMQRRKLSHIVSLPPVRLCSPPPRDCVARPYLCLSTHISLHCKGTAAATTTPYSYSTHSTPPLSRPLFDPSSYAVVFPHDENLAGRYVDGGARTSALHQRLQERGCIHQARHGFERPGWFDTTGKGRQAPKPYDYYGAYSEEEGGTWRIAEGRDDSQGVEAHTEHRYNELIDGELTFSWPTRSVQ